MMNLNEPMRILHCQLKLRNDTRDEDMRNIHALYYARDWVTHVAFVAPSWQEAPDAVNHRTVRHAIGHCRSWGLPVIWGRNLWVSWPSDKLEAPMPGVQANMEAAYHAAAIANVKAEARNLGAAGTILNAEPYGASPQKRDLKEDFNLHPGYTTSTREAIEDAVDVTGPVDFITPTSSMIMRAYQWSMVKLGKYRMDQKTYKLKTADGRVNANPPDGVEHKVHVWGHWVGENALSVADVKAFDMVRVRERYPECIGQWVYADKLADTLKAWNG